MLGSSIFLLLVGLVGTIYGFVQRDSVEYKLASVLEAKEATQIDSILYIGIAALVAGLFLMFFYFYKKSQR